MNSYVLRVLIVPSSVFLSVIFGGAFGSGREVAQFISTHGAYDGLITIALIALIFGVCLSLCFELARLFRQYEYRGFYKILLGRGWIAYEVVIIIGLIVALAVCASSSGAVLNTRFGVPTLLGGSLLLLLVVGLNYGGRKIVEKSMIASVCALWAVLFVLLFLVLTNKGSVIENAFASGVLTGTGVGDAFKYAFTSAGYIPLLLFCATQLRNRKETFTAGMLAGFMGIAPAIILHFSFMSDYPAVISEVLPTYAVIEAVASPLFLNIYIIVLFVMIAQTGVGVLHGALERIDGWLIEKKGAPMGRIGHGLSSGGALLVASALASIGLVDLIIRAYDFFSAVFAGIFILPLFTVGLYKIFSPKARRSEDQPLEAAHET